MIDPRNLDSLLHPQFDAAAIKAADADWQRPRLLLRVLPAAKIVFTAEDAEVWAARGDKGYPGPS